MQLEVGKTYRTRKGHKVTITEQCVVRDLLPLDGDFNGTIDGDEDSWCADGSWYAGGKASPFDIVAEWEETPTVFEVQVECPENLEYGGVRTVRRCVDCAFEYSCGKFRGFREALVNDRKKIKLRKEQEEEDARRAAEAKEKLGPNFFERNKKHCLAMIAGMKAYREALGE